MWILTIFIWGTKIEIKIHQNFLPCRGWEGSVTIRLWIIGHIDDAISLEDLRFLLGTYLFNNSERGKVEEDYSAPYVAINEFGFRRTWRIKQISEGVIHRGR